MNRKKGRPNLGLSERLQVMIPPEMLDELGEISNSTNTPVADIVRGVLQEFIDERRADDNSDNTSAVDSSSYAFE